MQMHQPFAAADAARPLETAFRNLLREDSLDHSARDQDESLLRILEQTATLGFAQHDETAVDDAHRTLYRIYASIVWRKQRLSAPARLAMEQTRAILEEGFRAQLARSRTLSRDEIPRLADDEISGWFLSVLDGLESAAGWREFVREEASLADMTRVVADRSLFFLREPDPWVFAVPSLTGIARAGMVDLLLDEYGWGKHERMHSTIYAGVMEHLGLNTELDHYFDQAPWQYIATLNLQWMHALTPGDRNGLVGTIYLTEAESPAAMENYLAAWDRLGIMSDSVTGFYELHVAADEDHRRVAPEEIVVPICQADRDAIFEVAASMLDANSLENEYLATFVNVQRSSALIN